MRISDWSSDVCSSDLWTLGTDDLRVIVSRRRPHNRLGFAIQLCALRYPGRLLRPGELIPHAPLAFVADQLDLDPRVLADYAVRGPTRHDQLATPRDVSCFTHLSRPARKGIQPCALPATLTNRRAVAPGRPRPPRPPTEARG